MEWFLATGQSQPNTWFEQNAAGMQFKQRQNYQISVRVTGTQSHTRESHMWLSPRTSEKGFSLASPDLNQP